MDFKRKRLTDRLLSWKQSLNRQTLLISGVRHTGKTTLVNQLGQTYTQYIKVDLEVFADKQLFKDNENLSDVLIDLFFRENKDLKLLNTTLLFLDEIQACHKALSFLKEFDKSYKQLHVIAASSTINSSIFPLKILPLGKVQYLNVHPLNFVEFLEVNQQVELLEKFNQQSISDATHQSAIKWFYKYLSTGGMPAIVHSLATGKSRGSLSPIFKNIWMSIQDDVSYMAKNKTNLKIMLFLLNNAPLKINQRISFKNFAGSEFNSRDVSSAFNQLDQLGVLKLIRPTCSTVPPIEINELKKPILQFVDTGLLAYLLQQDLSRDAKSPFNKSIQKTLIYQSIYQALIADQIYNLNPPNFWVRWKRQSSAKIDVVKNYRGYLIPISIHSGALGKLKSLHQFMNKTRHQYAVRVNDEKFSIQQTQTREGKTFWLMNLPYYLIGYLDQYLNLLLKY